MAPSRGILVPGRLSIFTLSKKRPLTVPRVAHHCARPTTRSFSLVESSVAATHAALASFHSVNGLPWYVVFPLAAVFVRSTLILPLTLVGARNRQQRAQLRPKVLEARPELERKIIAEYNHLGPEACTRRLSQALARKQKELEQQAGIGRWQAWVPWAQLPIWLVLVETIRRMCRAQQGLLGAFGGSNAPAQSTADASLAPSTTDISSLEDGDLSTVSVSETANYNPLYEPSLGLEGCLWFPDLLVPDPQLILPFAVSGIMFTSIWWEEQKVKKAGVSVPRWSRGLTRGLKIVTLAIGPLTLHLPAAVHLYWVASASTALLQKSAADMIYPIPRLASQIPAAQAPVQPGPMEVRPMPKKAYRPLRKPRK